MEAGQDAYKFPKMGLIREALKTTRGSKSLSDYRIAALGNYLHHFEYH